KITALAVYKVLDCTGRKIMMIKPKLNFFSKRYSAGIILIFVVLILAKILTIRIDQPLGAGFHWHNEFWYMNIAQNFSFFPLWQPTNFYGQLDLNLPPLYPYLVYMMFKIFGEHILVARMVSVVFTIIAVVFTFLISRKLSGDKQALLAASLVAFSPLTILLGRNAQPDMTYVALLLVACYFFLKWQETYLTKWLWVCGIFLALSLFTKQFTIVAIAILSFYSFFLLKKIIIGFCKDTLLPLLLPSVLIISPFFKELIHSQTGGALHYSLTHINGPHILFWEAIYQFSPTVLLGIIFSLFACKNLNKNMQPIILLAWGYLSFYLIVNKHSYYVLPILPFGAILLSDNLLKIKVRYARVLLISLILISSLFFGILSLTGNKFSYGTNLTEAIDILKGKHNGKCIIVHSRDMWLYHQELLHYSLQNAKFIVMEDSAPTKEQSDYIMNHPSLPAYLIAYLGDNPLPDKNVYFDYQWGIVIFGIVVYQEPSNYFFWLWKGVDIQWKPDILKYGIRIMPVKKIEKRHLCFLKIQREE
ncbi:MAG: glycosyltransferase family 39 protein, partial [bacterium]|nr:glycosyltransferase family 39 protein [bacterium]